MTLGIQSDAGSKKVSRLRASEKTTTVAMKMKIAERKAHASADPECPGITLKAAARARKNSASRQTHAIRLRTAETPIDDLFFLILVAIICELRLSVHHFPAEFRTKPAAFMLTSR